MTVLEGARPTEAVGDVSEDRRHPVAAVPVAGFGSGSRGSPTWIRAVLLLLLVSTGVAYLWGLGDSRWANSYYSAAVLAGTRSWRAFFFGSADAANFISVDKPPLSLWVMGMSARIFGFNAWSLLVPQALEGVAAVGLLFATIRRWFSDVAALLAAFVMAATPVAVLMFRYNNPDALLTLLLVAAAYATVRSIEHASTKWLVIAAFVLGMAFLTKMMQASLVVPAFAGSYLLAAPAPLRQRIRQLSLAALALVVSSAWWPLIVQLTPSADRPYVGGTTDNSIVNLIFGYNGVGRLSGDEASGGVRHLSDAANSTDPVGLMRLFDRGMGGQVSWLIPAALLFAAVALWWTRRAPRTDPSRAAVVLWGGWLIVTALVFSFARGIIHPYYAVVLAPAIGAIVGIGTTMLWQCRDRLGARLALAIALGSSSAWADVLLSRTVVWLPWLGATIFVAGLAIATLLVSGKLSTPTRAGFVGVLAIALASAGPLAFSWNTVASPHTGADPLAGPPLLFSAPSADDSFPDRQLTAVLTSARSHSRWLAAVVSSRIAADDELATGDPVMGIGGYHGTLSVPSLRTFQRDVDRGMIRFFVTTPGVAASPATSGDRITRWVRTNFPSRTIGGARVYDLQPHGRTRR